MKLNKKNQKPENIDPKRGNYTVFHMQFSEELF